MEKEILREMQGLLENINPTEITSHVMDGNLMQWLIAWKTRMIMLLQYLIESNSATMTEYEKLRRENFGLKTTVKNLQSKLNKFYHNYL